MIRLYHKLSNVVEHSVYYMIELKPIKQLYHLHLLSNLNQIVEIWVYLDDII